jgi:hypothetical protein
MAMTGSVREPLQTGELMSEAMWYFADGDVERGPVTEAQLKTLIGTNNLKPDDLVWKEGMDDWVPAGEVPGLFDQAEASAEPEVSPANKSGSPRGARPAPARVHAAARAVAQRSRPILDALSFTEPLPVFRFAAFLGQPLILIGFLLVLLARGCDSLGDRYVTRVAARAEIAEDQFQDAWEDERAVIDRRRTALLEKEEPSAEDEEAIAALNEEVEELDAERQAEMERLRGGRWRQLASAARDAQANDEMWGFWREGLFWFGTLLFSIGLMIVGFTGGRAERWLCLTMLAIVVFSLFVGRLE